MSIHIRYRDGSEDKLLDDNETPDQSTRDEYVEEGEESLASLLGVSDEHVIDLEDDTDGDDKCDTVECTLTDEHEGDVAPDEDTDNAEEVSIEDNEQSRDIETDSNASESGKVNFEKLFGSAVKKGSVRISEADAGTSRDYDHKGEGSEAGDGQPLLPPPERPYTTRSVSKPDRQFSTSQRLTDLQIRQQNFLLKEVSQKGKVCCGIVIIICLVCMSLGLMAMAWKLGLEDLYIVGGIFGAGAVIFVIIFVFIRCTAYTKDYYQSFYKIESSQKVV